MPIFTAHLVMHSLAEVEVEAETMEEAQSILDDEGWSDADFDLDYSEMYAMTKEGDPEPPDWGTTYDRSAIAGAIVAMVTDEKLNDIVTTGLEGGYSWFVVDSYKWESNDGSDEKPWAVVSEGCECWEGAACEQLVADDPDEDHKDLIREYPLTIKRLRTGLVRYVEDFLAHDWPLSKVMAKLEDFDLNDADCMLQYTVFGENRYA